jgi:MFS superfamily sulfate permease-like transporter
LRTSDFIRAAARFAARDLRQDLAAGLALAAVALPSQMATAHLAGFPPTTGLIAFAAASIGFAAIGANHFLVACADSTIAPIFAGGLATVAASGNHDYFALCASFAVMTGGILFCCGVFRLGWIADLVSRPVTIGFLAGIAFQIVISQLPPLLGIAAPEGGVLQKAFVIAGKLGETNPVSPFLGLIVFAVTACAEWISPRIPGALLGVIAATIAVYWFALEGNGGVAVLGQMPGEFRIFMSPRSYSRTSFKPRRSPSSSRPSSWCKPQQRRARSSRSPAPPSPSIAILLESAWQI